MDHDSISENAQTVKFVLGIYPNTVRVVNYFVTYGPFYVDVFYILNIIILYF